MGPQHTGSFAAMARRLLATRKEHIMRRWIPLLLGLVAFLLIGRVVAAQDATVDEGFIFRASGDVVVSQGQVLGSVIVADGNATVRGEVTDTLWVISGDAIVDGTVTGDVLVIDGALTLTQNANVENVTLIRATMDRAEGAVVTGDITEQAELLGLGWGAAIFTMVMWLGVTLALIVAAVAVAALAGGHLATAGEVLRHRLGMSALTALAIWIAVPLAAGLSIATVIGIPLGVAIFLFVLPALWVIGYVVTTARVGVAALRALGMAEQPRRLLLGAALGMLLFQMIGLVPGIGSLIVAVAGLVGSGALILEKVEERRGAGTVAAAPQTQPAA
jgi:hypothetical protein